MAKNKVSAAQLSLLRGLSQHGPLTLRTASPTVCVLVERGLVAIHWRFSVRKQISLTDFGREFLARQGNAS